MKNFLPNVLILGLISAIISLIVVIVNLKDEKEPIEIVLTKNKTINTRVLTKDKEGLEFEILYEGEEPQGLLKGHTYMIIRHMVFQKNVLEILKHNSLEHLGDSLEYYITPIDSTFKVLSINTKYHLSPEVRELWDEYINDKKARNLEILYGK